MLTRTPTQTLRNAKGSAICFEIELTAFTGIIAAVSADAIDPGLPIWIKVTTGAMAVMSAEATIFLERQRRACVQEDEKRSFFLTDGPIDIPQEPLHDLNDGFFYKVSV